MRVAYKAEDTKIKRPVAAMSPRFTASRGWYKGRRIWEASTASSTGSPGPQAHSTLPGPAVSRTIMLFLLPAWVVS